MNASFSHNSCQPQTAVIHPHGGTDAASYEPCTRHRSMRRHEAPPRVRGQRDATQVFVVLISSLPGTPSPFVPLNPIALVLDPSSTGVRLQVSALSNLSSFVILMKDMSGMPQNTKCQTKKKTFLVPYE